MLIESRVTSYLQAERLNARLNYASRETIRGIRVPDQFSNFYLQDLVQTQYDLCNKNSTKFSSLNNECVIYINEVQ